MSGGECLPPRPRTCICTDCGIATEPPSSSDWWGKLAAGVRGEAEAESRIMTLYLDLDLDPVNPEKRRPTAAPVCEPRHATLCI